MTHRACFSLVLLVLCASAHAARADGFVLVGHSKARSALSRDQVKALFTGKTKLFQGAPVQVVVRSERDAVFGAFVDQVFGIAPKTLLAKIHQETFKGEMAKPRRAASDAEVIESVATTPGAIGVVSEAAAKGLPEGVAVLALTAGR